METIRTYQEVVGAGVWLLSEVCGDEKVQWNDAGGSYFVGARLFDGGIPRRRDAFKRC